MGVIDDGPLHGGVYQMPWSQTSTQTWKVVSIPSSCGKFKIVRTDGTNRALTSSSSTNCATVNTVAVDTANTNQEWEFVYRSTDDESKDKWVAIKNAGNGNWLTIVSPYTNEAAFKTCTESTSTLSIYQRFTIRPWALFPESAWYKINFRKTNKCLDRQDGGGAAVYQWSCHGGDNQLWKFERASDQYFYIRNKQFSDFMALAEDNGNENYHFSYAQSIKAPEREGMQFSLEWLPALEAWVVRSKARGTSYCVSVKDGETSNGAAVVLLEQCNPAQYNQLWDITTKLSTCTTDYDCFDEDEVCQGGVCYRIAREACTDDAQCMSGSVSGNRHCEHGNCCFDFDDACTQDGDCCYGPCKNGHCCRPMDRTCGRDSQCCSGSCYSPLSVGIQHICH